MQIKYYFRIAVLMLIGLPGFALARSAISIDNDNNSYPISIDPFRQAPIMKADANGWFYGSDSPDDKGKSYPNIRSIAFINMLWLVPVLRYLVTIEGSAITLQNEPIKILLPVLLTGVGSWWNGGEAAVDLAKHRSEQVKGDAVYINSECIDGTDSPSSSSKKTDDSNNSVEAGNQQQKPIKRKRERNDDQNENIQPPRKTPKIDQNEKLKVLAELLNQAIHDRKPEIVKILLEDDDADPDIPWQGEYPLHLSEKKLAESCYPVREFSQSLKIFLLIIENGADLDQCHEGKTLLEKLFSELHIRKPNTGMEYPTFRKFKDKYIVFQVLLEMGANITVKDFLSLMSSYYDNDVYIRTIALRALEQSYDNPKKIIYKGMTILQHVWDHPLYSKMAAEWLLTQWGGISWKNENFCQLFDAFKLREKNRTLALNIILVFNQYSDVLLRSDDDVDIFRKIVLLLKISFLCQTKPCHGCNGFFPCRYKEFTDKVVDFLTSHKLEVFSCKVSGLSLVDYALLHPDKFPDEAIKFLVISSKKDPSLIEVEGIPFILYMVSNRIKYITLFSWLLDQCRQPSEVLSAQLGLALLHIFRPTLSKERSWGEWYNCTLSSVELINRGADLFVENNEGLCALVLILQETQEDFIFLSRNLGLFLVIEQALKRQGKDIINSMHVNGVSLLSYLMNCWSKGGLWLDHVDLRIQLVLDSGYFPRNIDTTNLVNSALTAASEVNGVYQELIEAMGLKYASLLAVFELPSSPPIEDIRFEVLKNVKYESYQSLDKIRKPLSLNKILWRKSQDWRGAQSSDYVSKMKGAVEDSADVNALTYGESPLHAAVDHQNIAAIEVLLANGAHIEKRTRSGLTPLLLAVRHRTANYHLRAKIIKVIQLLLDRGADIEARSSEGRTVFHHAVLNGFLKAVDELIRRKINIMAKDNNGHTALHFAAFYGHVDIVKKLLEEGVDIDIAANKGDTALYWAAYRGNKDMIKLLLENGADPEIGDINEHLPEDTAERKGFHDCAAVIASYKNSNSR